LVVWMVKHENIWLHGVDNWGDELGDRGWGLDYYLDLLPTIVDAVAEVVASFDVYRTYLPEGAHHLIDALERAASSRPALDPVIDRIAPALVDPTNAAAIRLQQTSGMVMAKGVEDTAFYRTSRLTSLSEVGGDPSVFSDSDDQIQQAQPD
ncbi:hypothetical protein IAE22_31270, partial [Bacillus sp. S34]|nr:hypothetical protein [Bacillus sp. S34]